MKADKRLTNALLHIAIGALFCVFKDQILNWILTLVGVVFIINGIIQISNKKTASGILNIVVGIAVLVLGWVLIEIAMVVLGALLLIGGISDYVHSKKSKLDLIKMLVSILVGILLVTNGFLAISWLFIAIGVALIIEGVLQLLTVIRK